MRFNIQHDLDEVELYLKDYFRRDRKISEIPINEESKVVIYEDIEISSSHTWVISLKKQSEASVEMNVVINSVGVFDLRQKPTYDGMHKFFTFLRDHYVKFEATS